MQQFQKTEMLINTIYIRACQLMTNSSSKSEKVKSKKILAALDKLYFAISQDSTFDLKELGRKFPYLSGVELAQQVDDVKFITLKRIFGYVAVEHTDYSSKDFFQDDPYVSANVSKCFADVCRELAEHRRPRSTAALFGRKSDSVVYVEQHCNL